MNILQEVQIDNQAILEAKELAKNIDIPKNDALHAIIARNNNAILVTQDKHFQKLKDIVPIKKPEELI